MRLRRQPETVVCKICTDLFHIAKSVARRKSIEPLIKRLKRDVTATRFNVRLLESESN